MRLEYRLNFADYLLFNAAHQLLSVPLQVFYLLVCWMIYAMFIEEGGRLGGIVAAMMADVAMWSLQMVFNVFYLYSAKNRSLLTDHVVEVRDDAFYDETQFNRSFHYWPGIARVVKRPGFAAVYINALAAHIIPRRAFSSDDQLDRFVALVRERIRASSVPRQNA
jgi:hypothetical protein